MPRHRSRSRSPSHSSLRRNRYDDPRERRRDRRSPAPSGLLVRNISLSARHNYLLKPHVYCRPEDLRAPFERFGPIKDVYLPKNYYTGEPRGFGFVKFRYPEDAADAKSHLDRTVIGGREIRIVFAEENRKTPQEMRKVTHTSSRRSRRRSRSFSPRRRHQSYSRSRSPSAQDTRARGHGDRDAYYSPRQPRSLSRSVSPREDKRSYRSREKSPKRSRSLSRSVSPREEKNRKPSKRSRHSRSSGENGHSGHAPSRSSGPKSPVRSYSRSCSPR